MWLLIGFLLAPQLVHGAPAQLRVLAWSEYFDPQLIEAFEREHDVEVVVTGFTSDEHRDTLMADSAGVGFDLIMINGEQIARYVDLGWLRSIDRRKMPNTVYVDAAWQDAYPKAEAYGIATAFGKLGIAYRRDKIPDGFNSWAQLVAPAEELRGRIFMNNSVRETVAIALKSMGESINAQKLAPLARASELLRSQKPYVRFYSYPPLSQDAMLFTGEVWAGPVYHGDARVMQQLDSRIEFVMPEEGGIVRSAYFVVPAYGNWPEMAARFIDYFNEPEVALEQALYSQFLTPNTHATARLADEHQNDASDHGDIRSRQLDEFFTPIDPYLQREINHIGAALWFQ